MIERGLATPEAVAADAVALQARLSGQTPPVAPPANSTAGQLGVQPSPTEAAEGFNPHADLDAKIFEGASSPAAFNFGALPDGATPTPEGLQQESAFRTLFHEEGIPQSIGNEIGRLWNQAAAHPPTEAQLEQARQEGSVTLHKLWGDRFDSNLAVAEAEVQRMVQKNPAIPAMLKSSGLVHNPWLISTLYNLARARGRAR
jgi:hypothetical protein